MNAARWILAVVSGALTLLLGIAALAWPHASLLLLAVLFAISLLSNGITLVVVAIVERRVLLGLLGALAVLAGLLCLRAPQRTLAVIVLLIGSWWIISGVLLIVSAATDPDTTGRRWAFAQAVVSLAGGLILLFQPTISLLALEIIVGVGLIALGLLLIVDGFQARSHTPAKET